MRFLGMILILLPQILWAQSITVSGLSSGAYMAQQFHMAYSGVVSGAGIIAGGPYFCAKNQILDALNRCMKTSLGVPRGDESLKEAQRAEGAGEIDSLNNLLHAKIFVLAGTEDKTVLPEVGKILVNTYKEMGISAQNLIFVNNMKVGHAFPTESFGNNCSVASQTPFLSKCGRDIAGEILQHLVGNLRPKKAEVAGSFKKYEQLSDIALDEDKANISMGKFGHAYVPRGCESVNCNIHVAFHGCKQTLDDVQDAFIKNAGFNAWAESNQIIILYPQAVKSFMPNNPNGCWDWWGYTGAKYHTKGGVQMKTVMKNLEDLKSGKLKFLPAL